MSKNTDIRPRETTLYFLPVQTRVPLKFGPETLDSVTCARVSLRAESRTGQTAIGWGETPLSVQWVWPSTLPYEERHAALKNFTVILAKAWADFDCIGHALEVGHAFQQGPLLDLHDAFNATDRQGKEPMPWLAALVCCSLFDVALHDAFGHLCYKPVYETYSQEYMNADLSHYLAPAQDVDLSFSDQYPAVYLTFPRSNRLHAWHLVGGMDPIEESELTGHEPDDGYPVLLRDWIARDGLSALKVKLRGNDAAWDLQRVLRVGEIAVETNVAALSVDFNCTVQDPAYVNEILDTLEADAPNIFDKIIYVEQPFPYNLEHNQIDVHSVSSRKPLFLDESAHDWKIVRIGRQLGWTGVALKTCKTQTGAILTLCWAKAHGMPLMVQDLTNPMLAQIPHILLAAHAGTIRGVETNCMQFYPEASHAEATIHSGLYLRRDGKVDLPSIQGPGFGYRLDEIKRDLPEPAATFCD